MRFLLTLLVLGLAVVGCSDKPEKPVFLGDRLLATAVKSDDGTTYYVPQLESVEKALPECKFKELGESFFLAGDCSFENAAPDRKRSPEVLKIYLAPSRSGVNAITIDQAQLDFEDGLSLFGKIKGIKVEKLSCPDIEIDNGASLNSYFYKITKSGKTMGVYREDYNSGSGGASRTTSLYLGMADAPCKWSVENEERLRKVTRNLTHGDNVNSQVDGQSNSSCAKSSNIKQCLADNSARVNKYAGLVLIPISDVDSKYLGQYLSIGDDCEKLVLKHKQQSDDLIVLWQRFRDDGVLVSSASGTYKCGNGADTETGKFPKSMCPKVGASSSTYPGSSLYFSDDNLNSGVIVNKGSSGCTTYSTLSRVNGIHYKEQTMLAEGCTNKMDAAERSATAWAEQKRIQNVLICNSK